MRPLNRYYVMMMVPDALAAMLRRLPDLERLLARVQTRSCRLSDFVDMLDAYDTVSEICTLSTSVYR